MAMLNNPIGMTPTPQAVAGGPFSMPALGSMDRLAPPGAMQAPSVGSPIDLINGALGALLMLMMQLMQGQPASPSSQSASSPGQIDQASAPGDSSGGSSGGGSHAVRDSGSSSPTKAAGDAMPGGSDLGSRIAKRAEANAAAYNTPGKCLQETGKVLREFGIPVNRHPAAWQALPDLQHSDKVKEIHVSKDQLDKLPPGAIVVWDKGQGLPYGHISVALGGGREASSTVRNQLHLNTSFHVFVPVG